MLSLRTKFTLALLATSLVTLGAVGVTAYAKLYEPFNQKAKAQAFAHFCQDVADYLREHGTWEEGMRKEPFPQFLNRQRLREEGSFRPDGAPRAFPERPWGVPPGPPEWEGMPAPPFGGPEGAPAMGPPPPGFRPGGPPPLGGHGPGGPGPDPMGPPPGPHGPDRPRFHFLLMDAQGKVLGGEGSYPIGTVAPAEVVAKSTPIWVESRVAARALPVTDPDLTPADRAYLNSIRDALISGALLSLGATVLLGLLLGNRLSGGLRRLTDAVQAVGRGQLRQRVAVTSSDEVGILSEAFNRMSGELERAHAELQQSGEQIRQQAEQLREQSLRDSLTGLHNRRFVEEHGAQLFVQAERYGQPLSVMLGDLDFFKQINDTFSHTMGDRVLKEVAALMQQHTRGADLVARYGGEEFVLLFPQTSLQNAEIACETLRQVIEEYPWHQLHPDLQVTMSMGVSDRRGAESLEQMLARADAHLYEAKRAGRNRVDSGRLAQPLDDSLDLRELSPA